MNPGDILRFWFDDIAPQAWWRVDPAFDRLLEQRFGELHQRASQTGLPEWRMDANGALAEIIVLDQFSRNIHRGTAAAFANDARALALAKEAIAVGWNMDLNPTRRAFMYLPFMHSESPADHERALQLFSEPGLEDNLDFERRHKAIIDRFGRYPHRNAALGRVSTPEEDDFLRTPGSSF